MNRDELYELLEALHDKYNSEEFIAADPISVPHSFSCKSDIEISGLLSATIAWGARPMIVRNGQRMMSYMDNAPTEFVMGATEKELRSLDGFVHRTFNSSDLRDFILAIRNLCERYGSIGNFFQQRYLATESITDVLCDFRREFLSVAHSPHCEKHISSIERKAACKRLNMYLRWMVRKDNRGVDFGLWQSIPASALYLPLDVHSGNMARELGLLERKQNDWLAVEQVTRRLADFSPSDPVKYDFSLFGAGVSGYLK